MSLQTFFRILLRNWWIILVLTVLTAGSSAFFVSRQESEYRAAAMIELKPSANLEKIEQTISIINLLDKRTTINTIARKATSSAMQKQVAEKLNIPLAEVRNAEISAVVLPQANLIEIRATSTNPAHAADICNTVAEGILGQSLGRVLQMEIIDPATPPGTPIGPQRTRIVTLGALSGLVLGIIFALLEHVLRNARLAEGGGAIGLGTQPWQLLANAGAAGRTGRRREKSEGSQRPGDKA